MKKNKIKFRLSKNYFVTVNFITGNKKKFIANASDFGVIGLGNVNIDEFFYKFLFKEQKSIIFHELWHYRNNLVFELKSLLKKPWLIFVPNKIKKFQEFEADVYASKKNGKLNTLRMLNRIKIMVKSNEITYNIKTHPTIDERIKKIKNL